MNKTLINLYPSGGWMKLATILALLVAGPDSQAQEGSSGNTTIFSGAQMTFFGNHNFSTGGGGTQPGIINTIRTSPMGVLNFGSAANTVTGADDANYVDGYVRKFGITPFIFPVGDNNHYGPFAAAGDGTTGAYFFTDPNTAVTSMLPSGNYTALPSGGPFATTNIGSELNTVSAIEYWDIDGTSATPLTLTWDPGSAISALTSANLTKLTITGWDGTKWVAIPSLIDAVSVLGGASAFSAGSITTVSPVSPDTYIAYTFAARVTPLPVTVLSFNVIKEGQTTLLSWSTTAETNSDRFEIERSRDGKSFGKIGNVYSHGESKSLKSYSFTDESPLGGENLYRLKMVDKDETYTYSRIRSLNFDQKAAMALYPNPTSDRMLISGYEQIEQLNLYDNTGQQVLHRKTITASGIDVSKLSAGIYTVKLTLKNGSTSSQKIVVIK
jgi:hypothetical protein